MFKCRSFPASQLRVIDNEPISKSEQKQKSTIRKNPAAQRLIEVMEKPPHLTDGDTDALHQSIEDGKIPIKFDSPFKSDESDKE